MNRRDFFKVIIGLFSSAASITLGWPFISFMIGSPYRQSTEEFIKVPGYPSALQGQPTRLKFTMIEDDAFLQTKKTQTVWVIKHSPAEASVFSPICTHLNCLYNWTPENQKFICPCHNSIFARNGSVISGPAPRPLDTLPYKIIQGELFVKWEQFKSGIAVKEKMI